MTLPNFLIIGAAKAGTTSLYSYLDQHPQIYMSAEKEPRFFALEGETPHFQGPTQNINQFSVTGLAAYQQLFDGVTDEIAIGEASTLYLHSPKALERIRHYIPDAKIVVGLRDPAERAFSSYVHLVRDGFEPLSFPESLSAEPERIQSNWQPLWFYQQRGFYARQLEQYFKAFGAENIQVYLYEDLAANSLAVAQEIYRFLSVDATFRPDLTRENVSGVPKNKRIQRLLTQDNFLKAVIKPLVPKQLRRGMVDKVKQQNLGKKPTLLPEIRQQLADLYREDVLHLQDLIGRDLSGWLKVS